MKGGSVMGARKIYTKDSGRKEGEHWQWSFQDKESIEKERNYYKHQDHKGGVRGCRL